jgi:hypothetical protein
VKKKEVITYCIPSNSFIIAGFKNILVKIFTESRITDGLENKYIEQS